MEIKVRIPPSPNIVTLGNPRVFFLLNAYYIIDYSPNIIFRINYKIGCFLKSSPKKFT